MGQVENPASGAIYAHTLPPPATQADWELLPVHAAAVASLARQFTEAFHAGDWGELLGRWHDLGKLSKEFQDYIQSSNDIDASEEGTKPGRVDHSTFGAQYAVQMTGPAARTAGRLLAFCIAGHHAGLTDATSDHDLGKQSCLESRLQAGPPRVPTVVVPGAVPALPKLKLPFKVDDQSQPSLGFSIAFFTRMLFSALVDADRTATEGFCNKPQAAARNCRKPTLADLRAAIDRHLLEKQRDAAPTPVNHVRARVLAECLQNSEMPRGFLSLNVPTGGGKTLASLALALHHARHHSDLRRVIVAIPFTSIIEQTAQQYRDALGSLARHGLIEHHSNLNPQRDTRANKLASENWNAPLVVTTNVQLFESLFAAKTTPARKLHRIANSVIILDEAQTLPIELLTPTLAALKELVANYGCTVVLCTATQPALEHRDKEFEIGIRNTRPIIANPIQLHAELKRVQVTRVGLLSDEMLVDRLAGESAVLCIVNTKAHAASLYSSLAKAAGKAHGCFHLSTFMCAQHRRDVLRRIRRILRRNQLALERGLDSWPCRVISTQLIEAGVDVDFPCVYRAPAGFDSIAQAAGRCNREGKLLDERGNPALGRVFVFETEKRPPPGFLRSTAEVGTELANLHPDPLAPSAVEAYFRQLYWSRNHEWDKHEVMQNFDFNRTVDKVPNFKFRTAADAHQIIREVQTPILVPYNAEAKKMIDQLISGYPVDYTFFRNAQQYTVSVREDLLRRIDSNRSIIPHESGLWALANPDGYSPEQGMLPDVIGMSPEVLIQ